MAIPIRKQPEFRCESCGQPITHLSDVIIEPEYGYEGEAWGSHMRQEPRNIAITKCCRSPIIDETGEYIDAYILEDEL